MEVTLPKIHCYIIANTVFTCTHRNKKFKCDLLLKKVLKVSHDRIEELFHNLIVTSGGYRSLREAQMFVIFALLLTVM